MTTPLGNSIHYWGMNLAEPLEQRILHRFHPLFSLSAFPILSSVSLLDILGTLWKIY